MLINKVTLKLFHARTVCTGGMRGEESITSKRLFCLVKEWRGFDGLGRRALTFLRRDLELGEQSGKAYEMRGG